MSRHLWVVGNWKMHGHCATHAARAEALKTITPNAYITVSIAPPHVYLAQMVSILSASPVKISAQDVSRFANDGAYTGEISANMLVDIGVSYVLIGHSERRRYFSVNESDWLDKLNATVEAGLLPIFCVGENAIQRQKQQTESIIAGQLESLCQATERLTHIVIAYEPVWAIGSGVSATSQQISDAHLFIKRFILQKRANVASISVLYGGSVTADNAGIILSTDGVDGVLVGGASLRTEEFLNICLTAEGVVASWT